MRSGARVQTIRSRLRPRSGSLRIWGVTAGSQVWKKGWSSRAGNEIIRRIVVQHREAGGAGNRCRRLQSSAIPARVGQRLTPLVGRALAPWVRTTSYARHLRDNLKSRTWQAPSHAHRLDASRTWRSGRDARNRRRPWTREWWRRRGGGCEIPRARARGTRPSPRGRRGKARSPTMSTLARGLIRRAPHLPGDHLVVVTTGPRQRCSSRCRARRPSPWRADPSCASRRRWVPLGLVYGLVRHRLLHGRSSPPRRNIFPAPGAPPRSHRHQRAFGHLDGPFDGGPPGVLTT
jgi:hypothetical protein